MTQPKPLAANISKILTHGDNTEFSSTQSKIRENLILYSDGIPLMHRDTHQRIEALLQHYNSDEITAKMDMWDKNRHVADMEISKEHHNVPEGIKGQLYETCFFLSTTKFPKLLPLTDIEQPAFSENEINMVIDIAIWYEAYCREKHQGTRFGTPRERRSEKGPDGEPELFANHPLRALDIGLGILDKMYRMQRFKKNPRLQLLWSHPLEYSIATILHDAIEDSKKFFTEVTPEVIKDILTKISKEHGVNLTQEQIHVILNTIDTLTFTEETQDREDYMEENNDNDFTSFIKLSDIIQNSLSPHTPGQKIKYIKYYVRYICKFLDQYDLTLDELLRPDLITKIFEMNPYLIQVFRDENQNVTIKPAPNQYTECFRDHPIITDNHLSKQRE